ncbi:NUDIX domain-containing protein [Albidovulum aquaemixtae]|uniref:NUDIX domain-containing protein n=1 Tax=Albidovulum aquaemixtae TaxID=1542388 RepID=UPI001FEC3495|nr:NUDIX domain-containing protein [Defluviimonas aquaemixtae]
MSGFFFYGTLCHAPLRRVVLGRDAKLFAARLPGFAVSWAEGRAHALVQPENGATAEGGLLADATEGEAALLEYYGAVIGHEPHEVTVETEAGPVTAVAWFPSRERWQAGPAWRLADWAGRFGAVVTATAEEVMRGFGARDPGGMALRYPMMLIRGGARVRARAGTGAGGSVLRRHASPGDVVTSRVEEVYSNYFAVEEFDLRFRRFDGEMSPEVDRAVFISGDAAVVLPYDPVRDRVLLIEQFRMGAYARGDSQPWLLEAVAGRVDGGETPEEAAVREAREEAGLELQALIPARHYYPSPAAKGEYLYSYVGIADLPDAAAGLGGLPSETEDIRAHVVTFERFQQLVESGEANTAPLVILAEWLARNRPRLRADAKAREVAPRGA